MMSPRSSPSLLDQIAHGVALVRIEAVGRLVQDQQHRIVQQRRRQPHAPAIALGERLDRLVDGFAQPRILRRAPHRVARRFAASCRASRPRSARNVQGVISP